jgi:hypothetical protein
LEWREEEEEDEKYLSSLPSKSKDSTKLCPLAVVRREECFRKATTLAVSRQKELSRVETEMEEEEGKDIN